MGGTMVLGGLSTVFLTFGLSTNAETVFLFLSRCFVLSSFTVLYIYTPEAYPTTSRSLGLGINNAYARMGGMVAPFIAVNLPEAVSPLSPSVPICHCLKGRKGADGGVALMLLVHTFRGWRCWQS
jgi:hypothetical protein